MSTVKSPECHKGWTNRGQSIFISLEFVVREMLRPAANLFPISSLRQRAIGTQHPSSKPEPRLGLIVSYSPAGSSPLTAEVFVELLAFSIGFVPLSPRR